MIAYLSRLEYLERVEAFAPVPLRHEEPRQRLGVTTQHCTRRTQTDETKCKIDTQPPPPR